MYVSGYIPRHLPLVVGTRQLAAGGRGQATGTSAHGAAGGHRRERPGRRGRPGGPRRWGFGPDDVVVAVVCRLTDDLDKTAGVLEAMDPGRAGGPGQPAAPARRRATARGPTPSWHGPTRSTPRSGGAVVVVAGPLDDPRPAYDAADVVLGMGSSVLKGMAFGKPVVVQGERGFWRGLDEQSLATFLDQGWYGSGGAGVPDLAAGLEPLVRDAGLRAHLGAFGRRVVDRAVLADRRRPAAGADLPRRRGVRPPLGRVPRPDGRRRRPRHRPRAPAGEARQWLTYSP